MYSHPHCTKNMTKIHGAAFFCSETRNGLHKSFPINGTDMSLHINGTDKSLPKNGINKSVPANGINGIDKSLYGTDKFMPKSGITKSPPKDGNTTKSLALQTSGACVSGRYKFQRSRTFTGLNSLR